MIMDVFGSKCRIHFSNIFGQERGPNGGKRSQMQPEGFPHLRVALSKIHMQHCMF